MKIIILSLLLVSLLLTSSFLVDATATASATTPTPGSCDAMCSARCAKAGIYKRCIKFCGLCCDKCKCVPSGTYGNKDECPCYRDMVNSKGQSKCP